MSPSSEGYGQDATVTITAVLTWTGAGPAPTAANVTIGGNGPSGYGVTSCGSPSGDTMTCTNTYTPSGADGPGSYTESASFSGDSNYGASSSPETNNFSIGQASTTTVVTTGGSPSAYGSSVTFTATINGQFGLVKGRNGRVKSQTVTGSVTWGTPTGCGTTTVTSGDPGIATCTTSILAVGNHTVHATYSGDANHTGSTGSVSQTVTKATTTIDVTSVSPSNEDYALDAPVTITALMSWTGTGTAPTAANIAIGGNGPSGYGTTSCGAPVGTTVTCTNTYTPTLTDAPGAYTETASFSGDTNYSSSNSPETGNFTINQETTTTSVAGPGGSPTYGTSLTFTATVNTENGDVRGRNKGRNGRFTKPMQATGSVTWSANTGCGTTSVSGDPGTATCTTTTLPAGAQTVTANYGGDTAHQASNGSFSQNVNQASQTIVLSGVPASAVYGSSFTVGDTAGASGNPVVFTSAGGCSNSGAMYTMTSGTTACSVIANQAGNVNYSAAPQVSQNVTAVKATPSASFTGLPASLPYASTYTVSAATNASTTATVTDNSVTICSLAGSTVTILKDAGTCKLTATWAADSNYTAASVIQMGVATKAPVIITWATPASIVYGTPLSATQLDATFNPSSGTPTYTPGVGHIELAGSNTLKVSFHAANVNYAITTDTVTLVVTQAPTVTNVTSADQTVKLGVNNAPVKVTVNYNVNSYKPTGSVVLTASTGETCTGSVTAATGNGSCKFTFTNTGTRSIAAVYGGDANHTGSNNSTQSPAITVTVNNH